MTRAITPEDATLSAFGQEVTGWKKFTYSKKLKGQRNKSGNNKATSYSVGDEELECTLELMHSQQIIWQNIAKATTGVADLTKLGAFPVAALYVNEENELTTDIVTIKILSDGRNAEGGIDELSYSPEILCLDIKLGVA